MRPQSKRSRCAHELLEAQVVVEAVAVIGALADEQVGAARRGAAARRTSRCRRSRRSCAPPCAHRSGRAGTRRARGGSRRLRPRSRADLACARRPAAPRSAIGKPSSRPSSGWPIARAPAAHARPRCRAGRRSAAGGAGVLVERGEQQQRDAAEVVAVEVRDQDRVDLVARDAEAARGRCRWWRRSRAARCPTRRARGSPTGAGRRRRTRRSCRRRPPRHTASPGHGALLVGARRGSVERAAGEHAVASREQPAGTRSPSRTRRASAS